MKNNTLQTTYFKLFGLVLLFTSLLMACEKKEPFNGISPDYKENAGTGGNPNQNNPTVTGTTTLSNPATENTSLIVGGSGWSNPTCPSTNSLALKGINGETQVTLSFAGTITSDTFNIASVPGPKMCALSVLNAPNQPAGITWVGKNGKVIVNITNTAINATFSGIQCTQPTFIYPVVSVSGTLSCSQ
jgi:hypothetical protein